MTSKIKNLEINGIIDTNNPVLDNLQKLCAASSCFFTFDNTQGKYSVVKNGVGTSVATFDDSNIIGGISVSSTDVNEMYNKVAVGFNSGELRNEKDTIVYSISNDNKYLPYETDNMLNLDFDLVNNPIQAQYLAGVAINQTRYDKIVQFRTDFSMVDLKAGNIITISQHPVFGSFGTFGSDSEWRITSIKEVDDAQTGFILEITAIEYNDAIYTRTNLVRETRDKNTGIKTSRTSACIQKKDDQKIGDDVNKAFTPGSDVNDAIVQGAPNGIAPSGFVPALAKRKFTVTGPSQVCEGQTGVTFTFTAPLDCCSSSDYSVPYTITGIQANDISIPLTGTVSFTSGAGSITMDIDDAAETEGDETMVIQVGCTTHSVVIKDQYLDSPVYTITPSSASVDECDTLTFTITATNIDDGEGLDYTITGINSGDLLTGSLTGTVTADWCGNSGSVTLTFTKDSTEGTEVITFTLDGKGVSTNVNLTDAVAYTVAWATPEITEGDSTSFTITADGIPNGVSIPWQLSGSALSKVTSATSGTVALSGGSGTVNVTTNDDSDEDGYSTTLIATAGPTTGYETCGNPTASLVVLDNDGASPEFTTCQYTQVPAVWCGSYDATTGELTGMSVQSYFTAMTFPEVGTAVNVPIAVSVTQGNPSTVTVTATKTVYTGTGMGGIPTEVITSFDSISPLNPITGTTTTIRGY